jgi:O-acetyl-ADP-ribose deacetylase (regulator of RNase III)
VWTGGGRGEPELLASCYRRSLEVAVQHALESIAFPSISTGAFGFPIEQAAPLAVATVRDFLAQDTSIRRVIFCCYSERDFQLYQRIVRANRRSSA